MLSNKYSVIPCDIIKSGINLEKIGINELAWEKNEINKIVRILRKEEIPVLGGDVYRIENGIIESTYDSWFLNNNGEDDFVEKSLDKTISYVEDYENNNHGKNIFVLVF